MRTIILSIAFVLCSTLVEGKEKVYVPFFSCENCDEKTSISATYLFAEFINQYNSFEAISAQKRDSAAYYESFTDVRESAELLSTTYFTIGKIVLLEGIYHISVKLHSTSGGMVVWKQFESSSYASDIPILLDKIAVNFASTKKKPQKGDLYRMSLAESERTRRKKSNKSIGVIVGGMVPLDVDEIDGISPGFGLMGSFDVGDFILQLNMEAYFGNDSIDADVENIGHEYSNTYLDITVNVLYPFGSKNNAPFVCLGSGFRQRDTRITLDAAYYSNPLIDPVYGPDHEHKVVDYGVYASGGGGYILKRNSDATLFIYFRGYVFVPSIQQLSYGAMLNFALSFGG